MHGKGGTAMVLVSQSELVNQIDRHALGYKASMAYGSHSSARM